jgi:hypothetical protein
MCERMKLGRPPIAHVLPIAIIGISALPRAACNRKTYPNSSCWWKGLRFSALADAVVKELLQLLSCSRRQLAHPI